MTRGQRPLRYEELVQRILALPSITVSEAHGRWRGFGVHAMHILQDHRIEHSTNPAGGTTLRPAGQPTPTKMSRQQQRKRLDPKS